MATTKSKLTQRPVAKLTKALARKGLISSRFKFSKLGVTALAAVLGIAGVVYVFTSEAASSCPSSGSGTLVQCVYNSPGIKHSGGGAVHEYVYWQSGSQINYAIRVLWKATYNMTRTPTGRYMWYGPGATVVLHTSGDIVACYDYMLTTSLPVDFNLNIATPTVQNIDVISTLPASETLIHNGIKYYHLKSACMPPLAPTKLPMTWGGVQMRVKIFPSANNNAPLYIYKTSYALGIDIVPGLDLTDD